MAEEGGWVIVGGHTVDGPEPMYGQSVTGEVDLDVLMTNASAMAGEALILTKPLGTGLAATAIKNLDPADTADGGRYGAAAAEAVAEMTRLNSVASDIARSVGARGATDVTGFGLLGHLQKMAAASGVGAVVDMAAVPLLVQAADLYDAGFIPGGTVRNIEYVRSHVDGDADERALTLLADAQTSGGLLFGCDAARADDALDRLADTGHRAAVIGEFTAHHPARIRVQ